MEAPPPSPEPAGWAGAGVHRRLRGPSCPAAVVPPPRRCPQELLQGGRICGCPDQADRPAPTISSSPGGRAISLFYPRRFPQPLTILVLVVTVLVMQFTSQARLPCERRGWTWGPFCLGTPGLLMSILGNKAVLRHLSEKGCRPSSVHTSSPVNRFQTRF